jgi:hypothetical protein
MKYEYMTIYSTINYDGDDNDDSNVSMARIFKTKQQFKSVIA